MHTAQPLTKLPLPAGAIQAGNRELTCGNTVTQLRYTVRYAIRATPTVPHVSQRIAALRYRVLALDLHKRKPFDLVSHVSQKEKGFMTASTYLLVTEAAR